MQLLELIKTTLTGMGYELVKFKKAAHGLLCIYIDFAPKNVKQKQITVEDCEKVTHQLMRVMMVENVAYERLEVSSPGLDRPLKTLSDYVRFAGKEAIIKFRLPMSVSTAHQKVFQGILGKPDAESLKIEFEIKDKLTVLDFTLFDVEKAYLVPKVDFRSRKA